jgi:hypothetical protein
MKQRTKDLIREMKDEWCELKINYARDESVNSLVYLADDEKKALLDIPILYQNRSLKSVYLRLLIEYHKIVINNKMSFLSKELILRKHLKLISSMIGLPTVDLGTPIFNYKGFEPNVIILLAESWCVSNSENDDIDPDLAPDRTEAISIVWHEKNGPSGMMLDHFSFNNGKLIFGKHSEEEQDYYSAKETGWIIDVICNFNFEHLDYLQLKEFYNFT